MRNFYKGIRQAVILDANTRHAFYTRNNDLGEFEAFGQCEKEQFVLGRNFVPLDNPSHFFSVLYVNGL